MASVVDQRLPDMSQTRLCELQSSGTERRSQKQDIINNLYHGNYRVLVIYGEIFAGKAYFAKEVVGDLKLVAQTDRRVRVINAMVRCLGITTWQELMMSLSRALGSNTATDHPEIMVKQMLCDVSPGVRLILMLTNFEDILCHDDLLRRCSKFLEDVLDSNAGVSVIVTSRVNVNLCYQHCAASYRLEPMSESECLQLLTPVIPYCRTLEPIYQIVRRCCYRPALILRVCQILQTHKGVITPEEAAHVIRTPEGVLKMFTRYPTPDGSLIHAIRSQLDRLPQSLESDARTLCYLNGSFGMNEATRKLKKSSPSDFKLTTLVPLREHAIVKIDSQQKQIQIDPLIRAYLLQNKEYVGNNDPFRKLFQDFLGEILRLLRVDISVKTKGRALGLAQDNFRSLETTLTQAVNTFGEETYNVYLKVIELEEGSMSAVCPGSALGFYKGMAEAASQYGTVREQALLTGFYAVSLIEQRGDELSSAVAMVTDSLEKLTSEDSYHRVVLMRRLGWMHIRLGDNKKAKEVLTEARDLCKRVPPARKDMVEPHDIQIHSHLAIVNSFLGNFPEAEKLLRSTIPRAKRIMPDHPVNAVLLQTMGLNTERQGQGDKALTYYQVSGCERQKLEKTLPSYLVTNLNNRACRYIWRRELEKAFPLLERALNVRRKLGWWDYNTGLTLWYRANAYLFRSQPDESIRSCEQAKEVFVRCTPHHNSNVDIRLTLAHAHLVLGHPQKAKEVFEETLEYASAFQENMNEMGLLTSLEHLVLMNELDHKVASRIHRRLIQEAERLSDVFRKTDNAKYILLQRKLSFWRGYLGELLCRETGSVERRQEQNDGMANGLQCIHLKEEPGVDKEYRRKGMDGVFKDHDRNMTEKDDRDEEAAWCIRFDCRHCKMLKLSHKLWHQT